MSDILRHHTPWSISQSPYLDRKRSFLSSESTLRSCNYIPVVSFSYIFNLFIFFFEGGGGCVCTCFSMNVNLLYIIMYCKYYDAKSHINTFIAWTRKNTRGFQMLSPKNSHIKFQLAQ